MPSVGMLSPGVWGLLWILLSVPCVLCDTTDIAEVEVAGSDVPTEVWQSTVATSPAFIDVSECGHTKGCLRNPPLCQTEQCLHIVTWQKHKDTVTFQLGAKTSVHPPWVALGFSDDLSMPKTSVVDCLVDSKSNITIQASYNPGHYNQVLEPNSELGLVGSKSSAWYNDGLLTCHFVKLVQVNSSHSDKVADLNNKYYLFLAEGQVDATGVKKMHKNNPLKSLEKVSMADNIDINIGRLSRENILIVSHATLMIVSWMFLSSIGVVSSRHFKSVWSSRICGQKAWFQVHRIMLSLTALLTTVALVLIVVAEKWAPLKEQKIHPILGIIVASLMVINALLGLFRPHPRTAHRSLFNWLHCLVGNCAHFVAVVAMFFGVQLLSQKVVLAHWCPWVVAAFGGWRLVTEIIMTAQKYYSKEDLQVAYVEMSGSMEGMQLENQAFCFKTVMVVVYLTGVTALTITLLVGVLPVFVSIH